MKFDQYNHNNKKKESNTLPVSLSPNSSPSGSSSFSSFKCPTISSSLALLVAIKTSYLIQSSKLAVKAKKICEMEPLSSYWRWHMKT